MNRAITLPELVDGVSSQIRDGLLDPARKDAVYADLADMMLAADTPRAFDADALLRHVAVAKALHNAAATFDALGERYKARKLHDLGQLFLSYAVDDAGMVMSLAGGARH